MSTPLTESPGKQSLIRPILATLLLTGLMIILLSQMVLIAPRQIRMMDEFGLQLDEPTISVVRLSRWASHYLWVLAPICLIATVAAGFGFTIPSRRENKNSLGLLFMAIIAFLLTATNIAVAYSLFVPVIKFQEGLAQ